MSMLDHTSAAAVTARADAQDAFVGLLTTPLVSTRQAFVRSLDRLTGLGILIRRTSDETLLRKWEEDGTGVGAGFEIDRDALLQFTDPYTVQLAFAADDRYGETDEATGEAGDMPAARAATRSQRLLRILVEDTGLLYADLHPIDAEYARGQRSWHAGQAADMTGGTVEIRAEGMLLRHSSRWRRRQPGSRSRRSMLRSPAACLTSLAGLRSQAPKPRGCTGTTPAR